MEKRRVEEGVGYLPVPSQEWLGVSQGAHQPPAEPEGAAAQCLGLLPQGAA